LELRFKIKYGYNQKIKTSKYQQVGIALQNKARLQLAFEMAAMGECWNCATK